MTKARTLADNFAADINGITAGTGITGGGTSGTVTVTNEMATAIDAKADLIVGTGADTFARLAVASTAGYLLSVDSAETTGLKWAAPAGGGFVGCSLYASANIALGNDASPILTWDSEVFDTDAFHSTATNTSRITIPSGKGGKYLLIASVGFAADSDGYRLGGFLKNGLNNLYATQVANLSATIAPIINFSTIVEAVATDYFEVQVNQTSGGNLNFLGGIANNRYSAIYLGA